ncbi:MAG: hypothetical protein P1U63_09315 [Coxiellaceae bacterium]|nr:hypothetical protein [Coxiellaceae bacterium]
MNFKGLIALTALVCCSTSYAVTSPNDEVPAKDYKDLPWMTGPIMAQPGNVVPGGDVNWEPYLFVTDKFGTYNNRGKVIHTKPTITTQPLLALTIGVLKWMDFELIAPYSFNNKDGQSFSFFADISTLLGFQAMKDDPKSWWYPSLRVTLEETFPAGRYQKLNPAKLGTDATGAGSYQSAIGLNFQKVWHFSGVHYLSTRVSYTYTVPSNVNLLGLNSFGGGAGTLGTINLGNSQNLDVAFEYSVTANWVLASDIIYNNTAPSIFSGVPGTTPTGAVAPVGQPSSHYYSLTPSIEYNWNMHLGVIVGSWFTVGGDNTTDFAGAAMALNYYI